MWISLNACALHYRCVRIGGGIRDKDAVDLYLEMGVNRVILGSVALKNPELTKTGDRRIRPRTHRYRCRW